MTITETDEILLAIMASDGNRQAFDKLLTPYIGRLKAIIVGRANSFTSHHDDILNECLLNLWLNIGSWEGRSSFYTWMYRIVYNRIMLYLRKPVRDTKKLVSSTTDDEDDGPYVRETSDTPHQIYEAALYMEALAEAFEALSPEMQVTMTLREVDMMNMNEISDKLGIPENTVKSRLRRARDNINAYLSVKLGEGFTPVGGSKERLSNTARYQTR
jgi:RNA polymerase sigma-70 factor (ECF subfamily)